MYSCPASYNPHQLCILSASSQNETCEANLLCRESFKPVLHSAMLHFHVLFCTVFTELLVCCVICCDLNDQSYS